MKNYYLALVGVFCFLNSNGQGTFLTADNLMAGAVVSGTVTDNNNGPVNIPFHFYRTQLAGNGVIRIFSQVTNSSMTNAGDVFIKLWFKDSVVWNSKQVYVPANSTVTDTFVVTGMQADEIYISFQNYGVVYGGPFNYTTHYELSGVNPNNEIEPNDFHTQAQIIMPDDSIFGHISYKGSSYYLDEYDFFKLVMPENGTADLYYTFTNLCIAPGFNIPAPTVYARGKDSLAYVSMAHSSTAYSNNLTIANNSNTSFENPVFDTLHIYGRAKDTIVIHMQNYFSGWGIGYCGSYKLIYKMSDLASSNEIYPNDDLAQAQVLSFSDTIQGIIGYFDGVNNIDRDDYFKFARPAGDSIRFYITATNKFKYEPTSTNPSLYAYDGNGNTLIVYSATGASSGSGQLIGNVWQQPTDVPISDTMIVRSIPTDSVYIRVYNYDASFTYQLRVLPSVTGINEIFSQNFNMNVYPNPISGHINLLLDSKHAGKAEINFCSANGAKIASLFSGKIAGKQEIRAHLPLVSDGVYFISLMVDGKNVMYEKVIVRK